MIDDTKHKRASERKRERERKNKLIIRDALERHAKFIRDDGITVNENLASKIFFEVIRFSDTSSRYLPYETYFRSRIPIFFSLFYRSSSGGVFAITEQTHRRIGNDLPSNPSAFLTSSPRLHYPTWSRHKLPRERHHDLSRFTFFFAIFAFFRYRITVRVSKENLTKNESVHSPDLKVPPSQFSSAVRIWKKAKRPW